jgi:hypothetical protein
MGHQTSGLNVVPPYFRKSNPGRPVLGQSLPAVFQIVSDASRTLLFMTSQHEMPWLTAACFITEITEQNLMNHGIGDQHRRLNYGPIFPLHTASLKFQSNVIIRIIESCDVVPVL